MSAVVFNINAAQQTTENQALNNNVLSQENSIKTIARNNMNVSNVASTTAVAVAMNAGKQTFNLVTSYSGKITGNSHLQDKVNIGLKVAAYATSYAVGIGTGNIAQLVMTTAALAADATTSIVNKNLNEKEDKIRNAQTLAMAGTLRGRKH